MPRRLQASLSAPSFRPYASDDVTGVALGGAAKNVYAIACGVVEGLGLGENARAALLARSFAELARLGEALGAKRETLMGLSGLGDLVLTATSKSSRNFSFGVEPGPGQIPGRTGGARPSAGGRRGDRAGPGQTGARRTRSSFPLPKPWPIFWSGELPLSEALDAADEQEVEKRMNYWLFKTEPETWSWEMQKKKGAKGEPWSGVRNHIAKKNMKAMKKGDLGFFYHTGEEKAVVGIVEVIGEYRPDPTDETRHFRPGGGEGGQGCSPSHVTLAECKANPKLSDMVLVKSSRLSVQPVTPQEWKIVCAMGGLK